MVTLKKTSNMQTINIEREIWLKSLTDEELETSIRNLTYELTRVWRSNDRSKYLAASSIESQIEPMREELTLRNKIILNMYIPQ